MSKKTSMLSIGELSKYTGASIRSLRYYEQMKILNPAYIDPDSAYRYYTIDQVNLVEMIIFCVGLGIPLKELSKMTDTDNSINLRKFIEQGKILADSKLKSLNRGLRLFEEIERQMDLSEIYAKGQVYPRKIKEKVFYVLECSQPQTKMNQLDIIKTFMDMPFSEDDYAGLIEYGFMYEYSKKGVLHYAFVEIPKILEMLNKENIKVIPAGIYFCSLGDNGQIEAISDIFKEHLAGKDSFIAIETEIMSDKYELNKPFSSELRVISI